MRYRVCWNASSNITFNGESDWYDLDSPDDKEIIEGDYGELERMAIEASGFDFWVEFDESDG
jgi:hypothetical protein